MPRNFAWAAAMAFGLAVALDALIVPDRADAQSGSVGGQLGQPDKSISGDRPATKKSAKNAPRDITPRSIAGQWNWTAECSKTGHWEGGFLLRQNSDGTIGGEFNGGHPGSFSGRITGNKISFTRSFWTVTQPWHGTISGQAMSGSFSDPANGHCTFRATH